VEASAQADRSRRLLGVVSEDSHRDEWEMQEKQGGNPWAYLCRAHRQGQAAGRSGKRKVLRAAEEAGVEPPEADGNSRDEEKRL
jgi:hypothetical protein